MQQYSEEKINSIRDEIIDVCEELYQTMSFKDISLKEIGRRTSCTRTSIYNYFQNKEEIFLALMTREYERWIADLSACKYEDGRVSVDQAADTLAKTLSRRIRLLKLLAMNLYDIEMNSRVEALVKFKTAYGRALNLVSALVAKQGLTPTETEEFVYAFFPFLFGIYPYTTVTAKQKQAMQQAGFEYIQPSAYEIIYKCAKNLLQGGKI